MEQMNSKYLYEGPVMIFGKCVTNKFTATTRASSSSKARSNFEYQYKKNNNLTPIAKIDLPGKIILVERGL